MNYLNSFKRLCLKRMISDFEMFSLIWHFILTFVFLNKNFLLFKIISVGFFGQEIKCHREILKFTFLSKSFTFIAHFCFSHAFQTDILKLFKISSSCLLTLLICNTMQFKFLRKFPLKVYREV